MSIGGHPQTEHQQLAEPSRVLRFPMCEDMVGPALGGCSNSLSKTRSLEWPFPRNSEVSWQES